MIRFEKPIRGAVMEHAMQPELVDSHEPIGLADIKEFEAELGSSLPADYREFLLRCNGGAFADQIVLPGCDAYPFETFVTFRPLERLDSPDNDFEARLLFITSDGYASLMACCDGPHAGKIFVDFGDGPEVAFGSFSDLYSAFRIVPKVNLEEQELMRAIQLNDVERVRRASLREIRDVRGAHGQDALICAARYNRPNLMRIMLQKGASVAFTDDQGWTALAHAAICEANPEQTMYGPRADCIRLLIEYGAMIDHRVEDESTILMAAFRHDLLARSRHLLIDAGADLTVQNRFGETPLSCCAWILANDSETLDKILEQEPPI